MPTPTPPLVQAAQDARDARAGERDAAAGDLARDRDEARTQREAAAAATADLAKKEQEVARLRAELARATVPTDAETLVRKIAEAEAAIRTLAATARRDAEAAGRARAAAGVASARLARAEAALKAAEETLKRAKEESDRRRAWIAAAQAAPLDTLKQRAGDADTEEPYTAAKTAVEDAIPGKLLAAARRRFEVERRRVLRLAHAVRTAEEWVSGEMEANGGPAGRAESERIRLARADAAVRAWVEQGPARLSAALARLAAVADAAPLLGAEETQRLTDLAAEGEPAADARVELEDRLDAARAAQDDLSDEQLAELAESPAADPAAADAALQTALGELQTADAAFRDPADDHDVDFAAWAEAVPEDAWRHVLDFLRAEAELADLADPKLLPGDPDDASDAGEDLDPAALEAEITAREQALADALAEAREDLDRLAALRDHLALRAAFLAEAEGAREAALLAAVRGVEPQGGNVV